MDEPAAPTKTYEDARLNDPFYCPDCEVKLTADGNSYPNLYECPDTNGCPRWFLEKEGLIRP